MNMALAGVSAVDIDNPAEVILFYEENAWPNGERCVAFADSHAKVLSSDNWTKYSKTLKLKIKKSAKPLPANYGIGK